MVSLLVSLLLTTVFLRLIAASIPDLIVEDWRSAFAAACVMMLAGYAMGFVWDALPPSDAWVSLVFSCITSAIALAVAAFVLPGIQARGPTGVAVAGVLLTLLQFGVDYALALIRSSELLDGLT